LSWFLDKKTQASISSYHNGRNLGKTGDTSFVFFKKEVDEMVHIKKKELDCAGLSEMGQAGWPGM